jgi:hypothetical protein
MSGNAHDRAREKESRSADRRCPNLPRSAGLAFAAATLAILAAACGGSSGSAGSAGAGAAASTSSGNSPSASPSAAAAAAAGGSMGCLAGSWRSNNVSDANLHIVGGAGAILTISGNGHFVMNAAGMKPLTAAEAGIKTSMRFVGQESGVFRVSGNKLTGTYHPGNLTVRASFGGTTINLPLSKFSKDSNGVAWESFSCSGNTLTMINPPPASSWTFSRTG